MVEVIDVSPSTKKVFSAVKLQSRYIFTVDTKQIYSIKGSVGPDR